MRKINIANVYIYDDGRIIKHCGSGEHMKTEAELLYALSQAMIQREAIDKSIVNMRKLLSLPEESGESHVTRSDSSMTDDSESV
jgi:hypothetical protein